MRPCASCGRPYEMPGAVVSCTERLHKGLCDSCGAKWIMSPEAGLHAQLLMLGETLLARSQWENWKVLAGRTA